MKVINRKKFVMRNTESVESQRTEETGYPPRQSIADATTIAELRERTQSFRRDVINRSHGNFNAGDYAYIAWCDGVLFAITKCESLISAPSQAPAATVREQ